MKDLGERIREIRKRKGMRQDDLADKLEVSNTYISKLENGKKQITIKQLEKVAEALGVELTELLKEEERIQIKDDEWVYLFGELKDQGLSPDEVRFLVEIAKKHIKDKY